MLPGFTQRVGVCRSRPSRSRRRLVSDHQDERPTRAYVLEWAVLVCVGRGLRSPNPRHNPRNLAVFRRLGRTRALYVPLPRVERSRTTAAKPHASESKWNREHQPTWQPVMAKALDSTTVWPPRYQAMGTDRRWAGVSFLLVSPEATFCTVLVSSVVHLQHVYDRSEKSPFIGFDPLLGLVLSHVP